MNETRNQQEPSMEEILASIRRIISEDGQGRGATPDTEDRAETPREYAQPDSSDEVPDLPEAEEKDADILVLTEMLAEDGSVVSLNRSADLASSADLVSSAGL